jgi:hypothetical protein
MDNVVETVSPTARFHLTLHKTPNATPSTTSGADISAAHRLRNATERDEMATVDRSLQGGISMVDMSNSNAVKGDDSDGKTRWTARLVLAVIFLCMLTTGTKHY